MLKNEGPADLREICIALSANMLELAGKGDYEVCRNMANKALADGSALRKFSEMIASQHGDASIIENSSRLGKAPFSLEVRAHTSGFVSHMDTGKRGIASVLLGAGRKTKEDKIDYTAGVLLKKKYGEKVQEGETLVTLYTSDESTLTAALAEMQGAYAIEKLQPAAEKLVFAKVTSENIEIF